MGGIAILIALAERRRTGRALYCENPQLNAAMGMVAHILRTTEGRVVGAGRLDVLQMGVEALESVYETSDGWVCLVVRTDDEIGKLEELLGLNILADERFADPGARREHRDELTELLRDRFARRTSFAWVEEAARAAIPLVVPAGEAAMEDLLHDPDQRNIGRVVEVQHPVLGRVRELTQLVRVNGSRVPHHKLAPGLGEHTEEILMSAGCTAEQIADFRSRREIVTFTREVGRSAP